MDFLMHTEDPLDDLLNDVGQDAPGEFEDTICDALKRSLSFDDLEALGAEDQQTKELLDIIGGVGQEPQRPSLVAAAQTSWHPVGQDSGLSPTMDDVMDALGSPTTPRLALSPPTFAVPAKPPTPPASGGASDGSSWFEQKKQEWACLGQQPVGMKRQSRTESHNNLCALDGNQQRKRNNSAPTAPAIPTPSQPASSHATRHVRSATASHAPAAAAALSPSELQQKMAMFVCKKEEAPAPFRAGRAQSMSMAGQGGPRLSLFSQPAGSQSSNGHHHDHHDHHHSHHSGGRSHSMAAPQPPTGFLANLFREARAAEQPANVLRQAAAARASSSASAPAPAPAPVPHILQKFNMFVSRSASVDKMTREQEAAGAMAVDSHDDDDDVADTTCVAPSSWWGAIKKQHTAPASSSSPSPAVTGRPASPASAAGAASAAPQQRQQRRQPAAAPASGSGSGSGGSSSSSSSSGAPQWAPRLSAGASEDGSEDCDGVDSMHASVSSVRSLGSDAGSDAGSRFSTGEGELGGGGDADMSSSSMYRTVRSGRRYSTASLDSASSDLTSATSAIHFSNGGRARSDSVTSDAGSADRNAETGRGSYKCRRCGQSKAGHTCPFKGEPELAVEKMEPETVWGRHMSTQCDPCVTGCQPLADQSKLPAAAPTTPDPAAFAMIAPHMEGRMELAGALACAM